jgi:hypothetical protein
LESRKYNTGHFHITTRSSTAIIGNGEQEYIQTKKHKERLKTDSDWSATGENTRVQKFEIRRRLVSKVAFFYRERRLVSI